MNQDIRTRATALGLAMLLTLGMLGGVNQLATPEAAPETMALASMLAAPRS